MTLQKQISSEYKKEGKEKKQKILMIEDDPFMRKLYRNKLTLAGFNFEEATNGEEGLNKVIAGKPDLVLLDIVLPRKTGFDVLIQIKKNEKTKNTPVIMLSALEQETDVKKGLTLGAQDYLIKGKLTISEALFKIQEWLKK